MTEENNNINELLKKDMDLNLYNYNYSSPVTLVKDSLITLFSNENWRLGHNIKRFESIDKKSYSMSDKLDITDFENSINDRYDSHQVPTHNNWTINQYYFSQFINLLNDKGTTDYYYYLYSFSQKSTDWYEVLKDNLLIAALKKAKTTHYDQLVPITENNETFMVDLDYNKVMKKIPHGEYFEDFFMIEPDIGASFDIVPSESVIAILYSIILGISGDNIKKLFLYPNLNPDELAKAQLLYLKNSHSTMNEIYDWAGVDNIGYDPIDDKDLSFDCYFYNPNIEEMSDPIAHYDIPSALSFIYHKEYDAELDSDQHKLTNALLDIADKHNLSIQRQLRRKSTLNQISHIDFADNKIASYDIASTKDFGNNGWIESVFNIVEKDSQKQIMYDMKIGQLVHYLVLLETPPEEEEE